VLEGAIQCPWFILAENQNALAGFIAQPEAILDEVNSGQRGGSACLAVGGEGPDDDGG
jgi:hypothetical protein